MGVMSSLMISFHLTVLNPLQMDLIYQDIRSGTAQLDPISVFGLWKPGL